MAMHVVVRAGVIAGHVAGVSAQIEAENRQKTHTPQETFDVLDACELSVLGRRWQVEVFSVSEISGHRYVQLALRGQSDHMLTLRVRPDADHRQLVPRLLSWLAHPGPSGAIVDVA